VFDPPIHEECSSSSHKVRLSSDEIEAIVDMYRDLPKEDDSYLDTMVCQ
jgi:hypothetical protein